MRLINIRDLRMEEFHGVAIPPYGILSHTWGEGEVTFQDWQNTALVRGQQGYQKIEAACKMIHQHDLNYIWIDTCCIDKTSSAELSEAINSMFTWYFNSHICLCYLVDVFPPAENDESFTEPSLLDRPSRARWFTRGWTLQELLAPNDIIFFYHDWSPVGTKDSLSEELWEITGIDPAYVLKVRPLSGVSIAREMFWASRRETTRVEDMVYCLFGIFDINIPLLYGEGPKAFIRLQEEILRVSTDHTIFCWSWDFSAESPEWSGKTAPSGMLAPSPAAFVNSGSFIAFFPLSPRPTPYSMTNAGLQIQLSTLTAWGFKLALINAQREGCDARYQICIPLQYIHPDPQE